MWLVGTPLTTAGCGWDRGLVRRSAWQWRRNAGEQWLQFRNCLRSDPVWHAGLPHERVAGQLARTNVPRQGGHIERPRRHPIDCCVECGWSRQRWRTPSACARRRGVRWRHHTRCTSNACKRRPHLLPHSKPCAKTGTKSRESTGICCGSGDCLCRLELGVLVEVTQYRHLRPFVERGFHFRRQRNVLDEELRERNTHLGEFRRNLLHRQLADLVVIPRQIEHGDTR